MELKPGYTVVMKKKHPCGSYRWEVLRAGLVVRLRCLGCERQVVLLRSRAEKGIKCIESPHNEEQP